MTWSADSGQSPWLAFTIDCHDTSIPQKHHVVRVGRLLNSTEASYYAGWARPSISWSFVRKCGTYQSPWGTLTWSADCGQSSWLAFTIDWHDTSIPQKHHVVRVGRPLNSTEALYWGGGARPFMSWAVVKKEVWTLAIAMEHLDLECGL